MTNKMKTVQKPRLILLACENSHRIAELVSGILDFCSYNNCIDDFSENTDFIIETTEYDGERRTGVIADTVLFDGKCSIECERIGEFRQKVTAYENIGADEGDVLTYSADNYGADLACRNVSETGETVSLDIVGNGILSRINFDKDKCTAEEVLICMSVLVGAGLPLAAISGYFTSECNN